MNCCSHTTMLFPDPRMRSPTALGYAPLVDCVVRGEQFRLGLTDAVYPGQTSMQQGQAQSDAVIVLGDALERADAAGLYDDSRVVVARAVYEAARVSSGGPALVAEVLAHAAKLNELVERKIAGLPTDITFFDKVKEWLVQPSFLGLPNWALVAGGAAAGLVATGTGVFVGTRRRR